MLTNNAKHCIGKSNYILLPLNKIKEIFFTTLIEYFVIVGDWNYWWWLWLRQDWFASSICILLPIHFKTGPPQCRIRFCWTFQKLCNHENLHFLFVNDIKYFLSPEVIDNCIHNDESCAIWCKWCYQVKRLMIFVRLETYSTLANYKASHPRSDTSH